MSATYVYKALDRGGSALTGEIAGDSKAAVAAQLRLRGLTVVDVDQKSTTPTVEELLDRYRGLKANHVTVMARQLATMISSGLSLLRALYVLEEQTEAPKLKHAIMAVRQDVEAGLALSQAMGKHPKVFSDLFVAMVKAGETGGNLEEVLERVAIQLEKDDHLRRTVKSAMVYPVLIGVFAFMVLIGMVLFIIPIFADMFTDLGGELPALTQFMITLSDGMRSYWYLLFIVPTVIAIAFKKWKSTDRGGFMWDTIKLRFPMRVGDIVRKIAVARFARTLGTLTASGVPILQALDITARTAGNRVISDPMAEVAERVREGQPLATPLARTGVFPVMVTQMLSVGEETGAVDRMLHKLADFYDDEVATMLKSLTSIIEPLMMIGVGVIVGIVVISMYMPMFKIFELVQ
ncbi:type II secretion system F family protein [Miltoncostaea oceani]|jgi:type IV pilus assembly protein PilC|uniref:type II secretion system F family protein n=1 Tax=Miltoncostaea oceani TaxID=2843216 RepID=UPI001C3CECAB|nr:type II secretion system F family protein [Miltoncostaea oceani]